MVNSLTRILNKLGLVKVKNFIKKENKIIISHRKFLPLFHAYGVLSSAMPFLLSWAHQWRESTRQLSLEYRNLSIAGLHPHTYGK